MRRITGLGCPNPPCHSPTPSFGPQSDRQRTLLPQVFDDRSRQVGGDRSIGLCRVRAEARLKELTEEEDRRVKGKQPVRRLPSPSPASR
jgi:hypothetical protein